MSVQSELDRIISAIGAAYDAVEAKGGTVPQSETVAGLAAAVQSIQTGGGGSNWTDSYSVFATGTFTPAESTSEISIDTGISYPGTLMSRDYNRQALIIFRDQDGAAISGFVIGRVGSLSTNNPYGSSNTGTLGIVVGSAGGIYSTRKFDTQSSFPEENETVWKIVTYDSSYFTFRAGRPYRWMLLGVLK